MKPSPQDTLLVVEAADTSLSYDRETKGPLYARAGIPAYWIVNLNDDRIEVYREPSLTGYRSIHIYVRGQSVSPAFAPDLVIEVDAILGLIEAEEVGDEVSVEPDTTSPTTKR
jgi:Uma2 family endonuclease